VKNAIDNCPTKPNPGQQNSDTDTLGNECDNCPAVGNQNQTNTDGKDDGGDACDADDDNDLCSDKEDDKPTQDASVVGWRLALNCPDSVQDVYGWDGADPDGDSLRNCKDKDDDNDGVDDANDQCPVNKPQAGTLPGTECQKAPVTCPLQVWWDVCMLGGCNEFLIRIVSVINPDPTIIVDKFTIRGRDVYLQPSAVQDIAQIEDALQAKAVAVQAEVQAKVQAKVQGVSRQVATDVRTSSASALRNEPGKLLRLEVWSRDTREARGQLVATLAEYDPIAVRHVEASGRAALKVTFVDDGRAIQIERSEVPRVDERQFVRRRE
jgi:hypothetical protein